MSLSNNPVVLAVLDGWGIAPPHFGNAITSARTPTINNLANFYPTTKLIASGQNVGLPNNDPGNTEIGHLHLGSGRVVKSYISQINEAITDGSFDKNPTLLTAIEHVKKFKSNLHLMGLLSAARIHAASEHLYALLKFAKQNNVNNVFIHIFTDGRDSQPYSALSKILELKNFLEKENIGIIASICGRFYSMDRDKRWERTKRAYLAIVNGEGDKTPEPLVALEKNYKEGITDEFIEPLVVVDSKGLPITKVKENDAIIFFNHRGERAVQLTQLFISRVTKVFFITLTEYDPDLEVQGIAFSPQKIPKTLGETLSKGNLTQLRLAESEKGRFVTYYFSGYRRDAFQGEERIIIPSPDVETYDIRPEMSAREITDALIEKLNSGKFNFILVNFANADMVGHTGLFKPTVRAVETVDSCIKRVAEIVIKIGGALVITGDHGNAEEKIDAKTGFILREHTKNPVPLIVVSDSLKNKKLREGSLVDVAPTILRILGIPAPSEMTGNNLLV